MANGEKKVEKKVAEKITRKQRKDFPGGRNGEVAYCDNMIAYWNAKKQNALTRKDKKAARKEKIAERVKKAQEKLAKLMAEQKELG